MTDKELLASAIHKLGAYSYLKKLSFDEIMQHNIRELIRHYNRRVESARREDK